MFGLNDKGLSLRYDFDVLQTWLVWRCPVGYPDFTKDVTMNYVEELELYFIFNSFCFKQRQFRGLSLDPARLIGKSMVAVLSKSVIILEWLIFEW